MIQNLVYYYLLNVTLPILGVLFVIYLIIRYITFRFSYSDTQKYLYLDILYYTKRKFQAHKIIILFGYFSIPNMLVICNKHFYLK